MAVEVNTNASSAAYAWLEKKNAGAYSRLIEHVLDTNGYIFQSPRCFIAFRVDGTTVFCLFAYGDMKEIIRFTGGFCRAYGLDKVAWTRDIAGKHKKINTYSVERFTKHGI